MPQPSKIGSIIRKFIKVLLVPLLFTDAKDRSIHQGLLKMGGKFEINWEYYVSERSKLIYIENRVGEKALQHLKLCFRLNLITFFTIIKDLFNYLKDTFGNSHQKNHDMEKFQELKMGASLFSDFYSKFIQLISDLDYILEMLIGELKHKLTPRLQDGLNFDIELPSSISALPKRCLSIYEQMQAINRIRNKAKSFTKARAVVNVLLRATTSFF